MRAQSLSDEEPIGRDLDSDAKKLFGAALAPR
jgi:hypothetical protein